MALVSLFGAELQSVIVSNGTGLTRLLIDSSGNVQEDVSAAWSSEQCAPAAFQNQIAEQRWIRVHLRQVMMIQFVPNELIVSNNHPALLLLQARAPPPS